MGHPRETNLPHDIGLPRPELAGRETGGRWGIQGGKWQVGRWEEEFTTAGGWQAREKGERNWQAGRETGRGIYRRMGLGTPNGTSKGNWQVGRREEEFTAGDGTLRDIQGRRIYHMTWDFQGRNWQVGRREEEFTAGGWASWELAGREMGRGI